MANNYDQATVQPDFPNSSFTEFEYCQWRSKTAYTWLQNPIAPPKNNFLK
jgi:hypothetical protein